MGHDPLTFELSYLLLYKQSACPSHFFPLICMAKWSLHCAILIIAFLFPALLCSSSTSGTLYPRLIFVFAIYYPLHLLFEFHFFFFLYFHHMFLFHLISLLLMLFSSFTFIGDCSLFSTSLTSPSYSSLA